MSQGFAAEATGTAEPEEMVRALHRHHPRSCTAVTCGRHGCLYVADDGPMRHLPAHPVAAVDTIGCDVADMIRREAADLASY